MDKETVARELAEEIRTNVKLRHRLGMSEGATSDLIDDDETTIGIETDDGEQFFIEVQDA